MTHKWRPIIFISFFFTTLPGFSTPLWKCIAKNKAGAVWNFYHQDKQRAYDGANKICMLFNQEASCHVTCLTPNNYWRCVAHDTKRFKQKPGAWYWVSQYESDAIALAQAACEHNSQYGGCHVNKTACVES